MLSSQDQLKEISFKFEFKGLNRVRLSNVSSEVIQGRGGTIGKSPTANGLLLNSGDRQEPCVLRA